MKHTPILFILLSLFACKKSGNATAREALQGKWEIRFTQAGMTPGTQFAAGTGNYLIFSGNTYKEVRAGVQVTSGTFDISTAPRPAGVCLSGIPEEAKTQLIWTPARGGELPYFLIEGNRLKFFSGCSALDSGIFSEWEKVE